MIVYGLKTCDTCRRALKALDSAGMAPRFVDMRADGASPADHARFFETFGVALINRRSTTWRGLSETERRQPALTLLAAHPTVMKRPVIKAADGTLYLGWDEAVRAAVLP